MGRHLPATERAIWTLNRIVINVPIHPSLADVIAVISILLIYYFPQHPPSPPGKNVHRLLLALMIEELITNSPAPNEMVLLNYKKIIIIIKRVRWSAVLSCDWWLDSVAVVTSAVWEVEGGVEKAQKKRKLEKPRHGTTPPPSQGLGNITSSTILSCTVICSRQSPRLYCTVLCRAQYSSVLYSAVSKL